MAGRYPVDEDLPEQARSYISSLLDPGARNNAREYARMDSAAFQARIGPGMDLLESKLDTLILEQRQNNRGLTKRAIAALMVIGAGAVEVLLRVSGKQP